MSKITEAATGLMTTVGGALVGLALADVVAIVGTYVKNKQ